MRGFAFYKQNKYFEAISDFTEVIERDPKRKDVYVYRGNLFIILLDLTHALEDFNAALAIDPNFAEAYTGLGETYILLGRKYDALVNFQKGCNLGDERGCRGFDFHN
jgi:tetratricopeptide (TPR) repeat protein